MTHLVFPVTNDLSYDQRMQRIAGSLVRAGYRVTLVGFEKDGSRPLREEAFGQRRLRLHWRRGKAFYLVYNWRLFWLFLTGPWDAIGAVDLDTLPAAWLAARLRRIPLVHDAHEYYTELPEVVGRGYVQPVWEALARFLYPRIKHHYTVSEPIAAELTERYGQPVAVFPNYPILRAVDSLPPEPIPGGLLYQGALNTGRGLEAAIKATHLVDVDLRLAGEGDLSQAMRAYATEHGKSGAVTFLGYLPPEELRAHTRETWLGLNLLEPRGKSYVYSLSNKFFDYVHAGVPQLAMDFPEYRRLNAQHEVAVLLPAATPVAIAEAIQALREDPARWRRLRANCWAARQSWHWGALEPDLQAFWQGVIPPV